MINTTPFINTTGNVMVGLGSALNNASGGLFGILALLGFYLVIFLPSLKFGAKKAFAVATFVGALVAILLRVLGWIYDPILFISFALAVGGIIVMRTGD